jgi:RNA polymerase sigma factor (TIGR02999 family)
MSTPPEKTVDPLLRRVREGDEQAAEQLWEETYDKLLRLAERILVNGGSEFFSPSELVSEAYLVMRPEDGLQVESKRHFFRIAARAMRNVIVRTVRKEYAQGRELEGAFAPMSSDSLGDAEAFIAIEEALNALEQISSRAKQVVELLLFGGLTVEEAAKVLSISTRTVKYEWRAAKILIKPYLAKQELSQNTNISTIEDLIFEPYAGIVVRELKRPERESTIPREKIEQSVCATHVSFEDDKWVVRKTGTDRIRRSFPSKDAAVSFAKSVAHTREVDLFVHDEQGTVAQVDLN